MVNSLKKEIYKNISQIIISAAILFSALAWRDAGIAYIDEHPEYKNNGPWVYALFVTIISIAAIVVLLLPLRYMGNR